MIETAIASETLSIEIQSHKLAAAALSLDKDTPVIDSLYEIELPDHVKPLYMDPELQKLRKASSSRLFIGTIPGEEVIQRRLDLSITKEKDISAVIPFEAEPLLPFPIEDALLDRITLDKSNEGTKIQLYAAKKDDVKKILDSWNTYQLDPEWICPLQSALAAFAHSVKLSQSPCFIVHLSHEKTTTCLSFGKTLLGSATSTSFAQNSNGISPQQDLLRILLSLNKQNPDLPAASITFVGELAPDFAFKESISSSLNIKEISPEGFQLESTQLARFALPIGAALLGLPTYKDMRINLRKGELAFPSPLKRYMKPAALYLGLCGTLGLTIALFGNAYIAKKEAELRTEYVQLLAETGKSYDSIESKMSQVGYVENPSELTMEDLSNRLELLDKEIKASPNLFTLQPNVPQVSDVLAWLSNHPAVIKNEDGPLTLESFSYSLVKRPELKKMAEKYRVKIEIEFTSPTPKAAREFHDALLAPNEFVDSKDEIKWSSTRGKYRASFYLKDKTNYRN